MSTISPHTLRSLNLCCLSSPNSSGWWFDLVCDFSSKGFQSLDGHYGPRIHFLWGIHQFWDLVMKVNEALIYYLKEPCRSCNAQLRIFRICFGAGKWRVMWSCLRNLHSLTSILCKLHWSASQCIDVWVTPALGENAASHWFQLPKTAILETSNIILIQTQLYLWVLPSF